MHARLGAARQVAAPASRPLLGARSIRRAERVAGGDVAGVGDPQDLALQDVPVPGGVVVSGAAPARVIATPVADAHVEVAVLAEVQVPAVVVAARGRDVVEQDELARGIEAVPVHRPPRNPMGTAAGIGCHAGSLVERVEEVHVAVGGEQRVDRDPEQALLGPGAHLGGEIEGRLRQQLSGGPGMDQELPGLACHQHAPVGNECQGGRGWHRRNEGVGEPGRVLRSSDGRGRASFGASDGRGRASFGAPGDMGGRAAGLVGALRRARRRVHEEEDNGEGGGDQDKDSPRFPHGLTLGGPNIC